MVGRCLRERLSRLVSSDKAGKRSDSLVKAEAEERTEESKVELALAWETGRTPRRRKFSYSESSASVERLKELLSRLISSMATI